MTAPKYIAQYEILDELGHGGFAAVYKACDPSLDRDVALKVLHGAYAQRADVTQRFLAEARKAASLRHAGIVHIYEANEFQGQPYIAMEYLPGGTLAQRLQGEPLPFDAALTVLDQVAAALDYAHKHQLVHRDIKPANILFDEEGSAVLVDFGLVKSLLESGYTIEGTSLGTPHYVAPEQAQAGVVGPWTDVYALGIVTFEMLAGRVPFQADTPLAVLRAQVDTPPPDPCTLNPSLGPAVAGIMLKALAKRPVERFQSAGAFVTALRQVAEARARQQVEQAELAQLLDKARAEREAGNWLAVQRLCVQIMSLDRAHPDALAMMAEATIGLQQESAEEAARRQRIQVYERGEQALADGQWKQAIAAFEEVAKGNPDFRDVQQKLGQARDELQRAQWYDEAIAHAENKRWADACRTWVNVLRGRPDYHGGDAAERLLDAADGLLGQFDEAVKTFRQQQRDLEHAREALSLYDALVTARENNDWPGVIKASERLGQLVPDLARPGNWLTVARIQLERRPTPGQDRMIWEKDGKEMLRVPAGEFLYGEAKKKTNLPEFWIDKTPVTHAEYKRFLDANPKQPVPFVEADWAKPYNWDKKTRTFPHDKADHPVVLVSWEDATAYAKWAGKRLPTEQEWEKAARGADGREYPWGAWEAGRCNSSEAGVGGTTSVGKYSPQGDCPFGCVDMSGNVWEWTASDHEPGGKVVRGGSWYNGQYYARAASRNHDTPDGCSHDFGFRCVGVGPGK